MHHINIALFLCCLRAKRLRRSPLESKIYVTPHVNEIGELPFILTSSHLGQTSNYMCFS